MISNARLLYATSWSSQDMVYGHALPCAPQCVLGAGRIRILAHPIFEMQGISVPISRGSPPVLIE